jgi:hypothetical protein
VEKKDSVVASGVIFYGLADHRFSDFGQVVDFYTSREEAEAALGDVLRDEPTWSQDLCVVSIEIALSMQ